MIPAQAAALELEEAYRRYGHLVLRRARRILGHEQDAHEVLQEIFMSLLHRPEQFSGRSQLTTWLYSATTHLCLNRLRNAHNRARLIAENMSPSADGIPAASIEAQAEARQILARVPEELARVAVYYYFDDMTHLEIASILGCSRRHVGDLLLRFMEAARAAQEER